MICSRRTDCPTQCQLDTNQEGEAACPILLIYGAPGRKLPIMLHPPSGLSATRTVAHLALRASRDNPLCRHKRQRLTRRYSLLSATVFRQRSSRPRARVRRRAVGMARTGSDFWFFRWGEIGAWCWQKTAPREKAPKNCNSEIRISKMKIPPNFRFSELFCRYPACFQVQYVP